MTIIRMIVEDKPCYWFEPQCKAGPGSEYCKSCYWPIETRIKVTKQ